MMQTTMVTKTCNNCNCSKELTSYFWRKAKNSKDGYTSRCKTCLRDYDKDYRDANKVKRNKVSRESYKKYKNERLLKAKKYYQENKEAVKARNVEYRQNNPDKVKYLNDNYLERRKELNKVRRLTDPMFKCKDNVRRRVNDYISKKGSSKSTKTEEILGCKWDYLFNYLCGTFEENYGIGRQHIPWHDIHIDHIIPLKTADTEEDVYILNHYTNLQLLFSEDNLRKSSKENYDTEDC